MATSVPKNESSTKKVGKKESPLEMLFDIDHLTGGELPVEWIKKIIFIAFLILIYIYYCM